MTRLLRVDAFAVRYEAEGKSAADRGCSLFER